MRKIGIDYNFCMVDNLKNGISMSDIELNLEKIGKGFQKLNKMVESGEIGFPKLAEVDLGELIDFTKKFQGLYNDLIVIGIGGSSLGFEAVANALLPFGFNAFSKDKRGFFPRYWVMDNVDSFKVYSILEHCKPEETLVVVISKSGSTVETAANFLVVYDWIRKSDVDIRNHIITVTDSSKGDLRKITDMFGLDSFVVPGNVGGRFSVLSSVGLLPAALVGIDIEQMKKGAEYFIQHGKSIFMTMSAIYNAFLEKKYPINVIMPYSSRLKSFSEWFCQLWGESLGKRYNNEIKEVYFGSTPVSAVGSVDQHSQLQLYKEGPFDKLITFIELSEHDFNQTLKGDWYENYNYLDGVDLNKLLNIELYATEVALKMAGRPSMKIVIDYLDEFSLGYMFMLYQYIVAVLGLTNNINPFDQPGVEEGKDYAYGLLKRKGYDTKRNEYEKSGKRSEKYQIGI